MLNYTISCVKLLISYSLTLSAGEVLVEELDLKDIVDRLKKIEDEIREIRQDIDVYIMKRIAKEKKRAV